MGATWDVFISYSLKDGDVVRSLAERLRGDGLKVWFDEWEIPAAGFIPDKIEEGLHNSSVLVLCMSQHGYGSAWAQLESWTFRMGDPTNKEGRFIPVRLDDVPIPGTLAGFRYVDWREGKRAEAYQQLLGACRHLAVRVDDGTTKPVSQTVLRSPQYFVYVSDEKISMLLGSVPDQARRAVAATLGIPLSALCHDQRNPSIHEAANRFQRLSAAVALVEREGMMGPVDSPAKYFRGGLSIRWNLAGSEDSEGNQDLVLFGARPSSDGVLVLVGNAKNIVGASPSSASARGAIPPSYLPGATARLMSTDLARDAAVLSVRYSMGKASDDMLFRSVMTAAVDALPGPAQKLSFVAKTLYYAVDADGSILVGSPLYVELED